MRDIYIGGESGCSAEWKDRLVTHSLLSLTNLPHYSHSVSSVSTQSDASASEAEETSPIIPPKDRLVLGDVAVPGPDHRKSRLVCDPPRMGCIREGQRVPLTNEPGWNQFIQQAEVWSTATKRIGKPEWDWLSRMD